MTTRRGWTNRAMLAVLVPMALTATGCGGSRAVRRSAIFYPPLPQPPRIQFLVRWQNSRDFGVRASGFRKFVTGQEPVKREFVKPHYARLHDGKVYVCDTRRGHIVVLDLRQRTWEVMGREEGLVLGKPLCIDFAPDGVGYVADNFKKRIYVFDANDHFLRTFGEDGQFGPTSLAVWRDRLYVADVDDHEIEMLDRHTGEVLATTRGSKESETGLLLMPANLAVDDSGYVYVSDLLAANLHVFTPDLEFVRNIGRQGDQLGRFGRPRGIAVDHDGFVYVTDAAFENCQVFRRDGALAIFFGGPGLDPGRMYLPAGVTISYEGLEFFRDYVDDRFVPEYLVFVANQYGPNGVSVYAVGHGRAGVFGDARPAEGAGRPAHPETDDADGE